MRRVKAVVWDRRATVAVSSGRLLKRRLTLGKGVSQARGCPVVEQPRLRCWLRRLPGLPGSPVLESLPGGSWVGQR